MSIEVKIYIVGRPFIDLIFQKPCCWLVINSQVLVNPLIVTNLWQKYWYYISITVLKIGITSEWYVSQKNRILVSSSFGCLDSPPGWDLHLAQSPLVVCLLSPDTVCFCLHHSVVLLCTLSTYHELVQSRLCPSCDLEFRTHLSWPSRNVYILLSASLVASLVVHLIWNTLSLVCCCWLFVYCLLLVKQAAAFLVSWLLDNFFLQATVRSFLSILKKKCWNPSKLLNIIINM